MLSDRNGLHAIDKEKKGLKIEDKPGDDRKR